MAENESQICQSCGYPAQSGHAKTCATRADESKEARDESYELFVKFLEKHGIDKMTKEEKVAKIKELSFDEIIQVISRINGRLAFRDKRQEWSGKAAKSSVKRMADSVENADLEPPDDAENELRAFFESMQAELNVDNLPDWASKTYFAIIFSHPFENGNGRSARNIYYIMCEDGAPAKDLTGKRPAETQIIEENVSLCAMTRLFDDRGIKCKDNIALMQEYSATTSDDDFPLYGNMGYLRFLAAREAIKQTRAHDADEKSINIDKLDPKEKEIYNQTYATLRKEWFWKVIDVCDDYKESVSQHLQKMVPKSEHAS